jgi:uncharacterized protein (TIGR02099 family)
MNQSPAPVASATRTIKTLSVAARLLLWAVLTAWGLFALSWGALHGIIVPRISEWRPELQRWASASVGVPVTLGDIRAESRLSEGGVLPALVPSIELHDVRLFDAAGREALHLPLVRTALSVRSLWRLGFEQVVIDRPVLDVRRTALGRIEVAGLDISGVPGDSAVADWFFTQSEFVIRGGTVRWIDDLRTQPPLALDAVDLLVRNSARTHQIRFDASPPPEWGERLSLRARLREPLLDLRQGAPTPSVWQRWDGELFADLPQVDVARLRDHADLSGWGIDLQTGQGALRLWTGLKRGQPVSLTADLALRDVHARLGPGLPPLLLDTLNGRIAAERQDGNFTLSTQDLGFRTQEGLEWPQSRIRLEHNAGNRNQGARVALSSDQLDLAVLAALAARLPLPVPAHDWLVRLKPTGQLIGLQSSWQGPAAAAPVEPDTFAWPDWAQGRYQARGRITDLSLAAQASGQMAAGGYPIPGRPGLTGAQLDFDLTPDGGRARLEINQGAIDLPGVFEEDRLALDRFEADARWRILGERIEAQLDNVRLSNVDTEGRASLRWHTGEAGVARLPGVLDLSATLSRADATRVHRYIPLVVSAPARQYVRDALLAGASSRVDFRIRGALDQMPLDAPGAQGDFRIAAQLQGVDVAYVPASLQAAGEPAWPALRGIRGELVLDRSTLTLSRLQAGVANAPGVRLSEAGVKVSDLNQAPVLVAEARVQGPAAEVLDFVRNSPLNGMTNQALAQARMGGPAQGQFSLRLPLQQLENSRVSGSVKFAGNDVQITPDSPLLGRATGTLSFSESGFTVSGAQARLYGGNVRFEGGVQPSASGAPAAIIFRGQGTASAEGLRDGVAGFVGRVFQNARGSTAYTAQLGFRGGLPELLVNSNLQGMAIQLPAPLGKTAEASLPLRFENAALSVVNGQALSDRLALQIGSLLSPLLALQYERDVTGAEPVVLRGSVAVGLGASEAAPLPAAGVLANLQVGTVDVDAWERAFTATTRIGRTAVAVAAPPRSAAVASQGNPSLGYLPSTFGLRAARLQLGGRSFSNVVAGGSRQGTLWRTNLDADELNGYLEYRPPATGSAGSVYARLARLSLEPAAAREVEQLLQQPTSVPALDIAVDELVLAGRPLGRVEVDASNVAQIGRASEWRLNRLRISVPEARLTATGNWAARSAREAAIGGARQTALNFRLDVDDAGQLLTRFGRAGVVRGGKGQLEGQIAWAGSPLAIDYPSLSGQLQMEIERGQFLQVDPGAAKLLGVLSLQALPRRLVLDFRDVFSEGFAFDFVRGDARIQQGVVNTNNLQMQGVNAAVLMEGAADLARELQDIKVVVVPEINAGTASLIATAINPAVGLGTFLAQYLLRQPLQSAATKEFRITGGWADPNIERVERVERGVQAPAAPQTSMLK